MILMLHIIEPQKPQPLGLQNSCFVYDSTIFQEKNWQTGFPKSNAIFLTATLFLGSFSFFFFSNEADSVQKLFVD
jgi:hypothetical protein